MCYDVSQFGNLFMKLKHFFLGQIGPIGFGLLFIVVTIKEIVTLNFIAYLSIIVGLSTMLQSFFIIGCNLISYQLIKRSYKGNNKSKEHKKKHQKENDNQKISVTIIQNNRSRANKIYAVNTLLALNIMYIIFCLPLMLYLLVKGVKLELNGKESFKKQGFFNALFSANSGANALLYLCRNKKIYRFYKRKIWKKDKKIETK